jgi:ligand-binding SRPBCC domain-containing protein
MRRPRAEVFTFHADAANLRTVVPFGLVRASGDTQLVPGRTIAVELRLGPLVSRGAITVQEIDPPWSFVDEQSAGPFAVWRHTHRFADVGSDTLVRDTVEFRLRGPLVVLGPLAERCVAALLAAKLRRTARVLERDRCARRQALGLASSHAAGGSIEHEQEVA